MISPPAVARHFGRRKARVRAVLAITRREVGLTWEEIHGVLELKAFAMGPGSRVIAIRGCGWNLAAARAAEIESHMGEALDRLAAELAAVEPAEPRA